MQSLLTTVITTVNSNSNTNVYIRLPNKYDIAWDHYVTSFSYGLWLTVAIAACASGVCLVLINHDHGRNLNFTLSAILFYIHACSCEQVHTNIACQFFSFPSVYIHSYTQSNSFNLNKTLKHLHTGNFLTVSAIDFHPK